MEISLATAISRRALCIGIISTLCACVKSTSTDNFNFPHYRFITTIASEPFHLVGGSGQPLWVFVLEGKPPNYFESSSGWSISGETDGTSNSTSRINSWSEVLASTTQLEIDPEGTMLDLKMLTRAESTDWGDWVFERQSNGHCLIQSEKLGPEFALTVDTSITPYTARMAAIDSALLQNWTVEAYRRPNNSFDTLCNGVADTL